MVSRVRGYHTAADIQQPTAQVTPVRGRHRAQPLLSRRERRQASKGARRAERDALRAAQAQENALAASWTPKVDVVTTMTLKELRGLAQEREIRVDGKRPSLCTKAELLEALIA